MYELSTFGVGNERRTPTVRAIPRPHTRVDRSNTRRACAVYVWALVVASRTS